MTNCPNLKHCNEINIAFINVCNKEIITDITRNYSLVSNAQNNIACTSGDLPLKKLAKVRSFWIWVQPIRGAVT